MALTGKIRSGVMVLTGKIRSGVMVLTGQNRSTRRKARLIPTLFTRNPTHPYWGSNPETNYLSYGTTL